MATLDLNAGAVAPVAREIDIAAPRVSGTVPDDLHGVLVRNGPNPLSGRFEGSGVLSWWPEAAMLHAVAFEHGRVSSYRNRWLRTRRWAQAHAPQSAPSWPDTNPNVNVIRHAGETLALAEGGTPLAVTSALDTLGPARRHPGAVAGMTAHPKIDPRTGELVTFCADWKAPFLRYGVADAGGELTVDIEIALPAPSMMHDIAITANYSILLDLNVGYDFAMLARGHRMPLRWHDERGSRLCVIPRHGGDVRWFEIAPCFIQHVINAYDADETTIVLDAVRYPWFLRLTPDGTAFEDNPLGTLWRYRIDLTSGAVTQTAACEAGMELPRINEQRTGQPYRYFYAAEQPTPFELRGVVQYDWHGGTLARYAVPPGDQNSEPIFVPRRMAAAEDDGWVLCCVYRHAADTTDVVVLDAGDLAAGPVATVHLPTRIPAGFHGAWLANED
ncbi:carotenoid oxygenase family protein [Burkholderia sp. TSV86]|uniref:carotenoid oxygenase family protein n=1 Tax=Burkholderia sp. TSV86 TaxID=1385594 RepID=UPI00075742E0|nr:carotenoid oxygenase family protein [Burkholderia sp. TSV86]KVE36403.1 carotenoid oxygenase [Burkholderia sp. TSV86]